MICTSLSIGTTANAFKAKENEGSFVLNTRQKMSMYVSSWCWGVCPVYFFCDGQGGGGGGGGGVGAAIPDDTVSSPRSSLSVSLGSSVLPGSEASWSEEAPVWGAELLSLTE